MSQPLVKNFGTWLIVALCLFPAPYGLAKDTEPVMLSNVLDATLTLSGVLATKLISADVKDRLGEEIGKVDDATLTPQGTMEKLVVDRGQKNSTFSWSEIEIRQELPLDPTLPARPVVILNEVKL